MRSQNSPFLRLWIHSPLNHVRANGPKYLRTSLLPSITRPFQTKRCYSSRLSWWKSNKNEDSSQSRQYSESEPWQVVFVRWARRRWENRRWPTRRNYWSFLKGTLHIFNFFCAAHLFCSKILFVSLMMGPSMLPTFANEGDIILEDRITYRLFPNKLARGDVIILESPLERGHKICKRVLGLPGDTVCVDPTGRIAPSTEHVVIPPGHVWLIGDNARASRDSRRYGPVPMALIKGRVLARLWPPNKMALFPGSSCVIPLT